MRSGSSALDEEAWLAWCIAGLSLFDRHDPPTLRSAVAEARRVSMTMAMTRAGGNLSAAARTLGTSRKALRDNLRALSMYPWPDGRVVRE
ncbi:MAG: helix-turn-helix domain-containing protein [Nannocystaceae bacterium]